MTHEDINFPRLNYLLSLELSNSNIAKRMNRAKFNSKRKHEYLLLCMVKSLRTIEEVVYDEVSDSE